MKRLALLVALLFGSFANAQDKGWYELWWSAGPKNYAERTNNKVLPAGYICLYWKDEPVGLLEPTRGIWHVLSEGKTYNLTQTRDKLNPRGEKDVGLPSILEKDEPAKEDKYKPVAPEQGPKPTVIPTPKEVFGVDREKLSEKDTFCKDGRRATRAEVMDALSKIMGPAGIPADAASPRLTVIGPEAERKKVLDDLDKSPELAFLKGKMLVQAYEPDHWRVVDGGFVTTGKPTIYCQQSDGTVLWRQDDYGGPVKLAAALRDKVPGYDPAKDPGPKTAPNKGGDGNVLKIAWHHIGLVLAGLFYFWTRKRSAA